MTERKPAGMSFTSWIDQQIADAEQRGAFDDLPGAGRPLPGRRDADAAESWLRDYARREGVAAAEMLPTPLRLRREIERAAATVHQLRSEQAVRQVAAELNEQVLAWRRLPLGPPIFVPLVDADELVRSWRAGKAGGRPAGQAAGHGGPAPGGTGPTGTGPGGTGPGGTGPAGTGPAPDADRRWWRRRGRTGAAGPRQDRGRATGPDRATGPNRAAAQDRAEEEQ